MTTTLTIEIEDSILKTIEKKEIEASFNEWLKKLHLRAAAKEILEDLSEFDLTNDPQWEVARELAWQKEKSKYIIE